MYKKLNVSLSILGTKDAGHGVEGDDDDEQRYHSVTRLENAETFPTTKPTGIHRHRDETRGLDNRRIREIHEGPCRDNNESSNQVLLAGNDMQ